MGMSDSPRFTLRFPSEELKTRLTAHAEKRDVSLQNLLVEWLGDRLDVEDVGLGDKVKEAVTRKQTGDPAAEEVLQPPVKKAAEPRRGLPLPPDIRKKLKRIRAANRDTGIVVRSQNRGRVRSTRSDGLRRTSTIAKGS